MFEGAILYHAIDESPAVGAGCFLGFGEFCCNFGHGLDRTARI